MSINVLYPTKKHQRKLPAYPYLVIACLIWLTLLAPAYSLADNDDDYAEISVFLTVKDVGGEELPAIIKGNSIYLSIADLFDFLKIKNNYLPGSDSATGFFINEQATFLIDNSNHQIIYGGKNFALLPNDLIQTETNLYLKSVYFGEVFGLDCNFNFRSLSVSMKSKNELPIIKERRLQEMRLNLDHLKGEVRADTTISRSNSFFRIGMADWSVNTTEYIYGQHNENQLQDWRDARINLALGAMIAGGESNLTLNYDNNIPLKLKNQFFSWRYVNNDNHFLRQTIFGNINPQSTSSIFSPVAGIQFTNSSTLTKQSFGSYRLSDFTQPNWVVELYINNELIDYTTADAAGYFSFDVPLLYGNSSVTLHYYGPWGEERTSVKNIMIPFNLVPPKQLEYTVSGGVVEENGAGLLRSVINYGLSKHITLGSGIEYLSSVKPLSAMPFINTTLRIGSRLLFSGEYTYNVRSRAIFTYYGPSNLHLLLSYTHYTKGQRAIYFNYIEERKADVSIPFHIGIVRVFPQLTVNQIILPSSKYTSVKFFVSGSFSGVGINLTNYALFIPSVETYLYGDLSLSLRLPHHFMLIPQAQYNYGQKQIVLVKGGIEKQLGNLCFINLSYERNLLTQINNIEAAVRFNFSFSQIGFLARRSNNDVVLAQSARGSIIYDHNLKSVKATTHTSVGKGGITLIPFLDMNNNGVRDAGEPKVFGIRPKIRGGTFEYNEKDSSFHSFNLTPYVNYLIELTQNDFETISWQIKNKLIKVTVDPNNFKLVEVPVSVKGEASGVVYNLDPAGKKGIGRIKIDFYSTDSILLFSTMTEDDGYFSLLGFTPGTYIARVDPQQLEKLKMTASPPQFTFEIQSSRDGDIADQLEFEVRQK